MTYSQIWVVVKTMSSAFQTSEPSPLAPLAGRRARRSAATRESLFRAALDLFAVKGFAETTVEDITQAADFGKGTFFNYFPSKDHLLVAFSDMQLSKLQAAVERNPSIIRALLLANLSSTPVRELMRENHLRGLRLVTRLVETGQDRREIRRDLPAEEIALVFRQTVFGTLLMWSVYADSSLPARIHAAFDLLWNGIAPRDAGLTAGATNSTSGKT
jgi:AcrR family transcriptional regulator